LKFGDLFSKKLVMVTGKGGIGKTVVSAALGQCAAAQGLKTLIIESSSRDQVSPLFGIPEVGHLKTLVQPNLSCINLTQKETLKEYVTKYLKQEMLYEKIFTNKMVESFFNVIPGFTEVMLLGRLFYTCELAEGERPDLVIFDASASGHFLSLMTTPNAVQHTNLGGPLVKETLRVRNFLADSTKCGTVFVGVPEELVVSEMLEFIPKLIQESPCEVSGVILNRSLNHIKSTDHLSAPVAQFFDNKIKKADLAEKTLRQGVKNMGADLAIWDLPEQGFIEEPIDDNLGNKLFASYL